MATHKTPIHLCILTCLAPLTFACVDAPRDGVASQTAETEFVTSGGETEGSSGSTAGPADADTSGTASNSAGNSGGSDPDDPTATAPGSSASASSDPTNDPGDPSGDPGDPPGDTGDVDSTSPTSATNATTDPPEPGCTPADDRCEGDNLVTCAGGQETSTQCSQTWCANHGLGNSLGCGYDNGDPGCQCEPALECLDGESKCVGPDSGKDCIDGFWSDPLSCDTYCQQNGWDVSLSCTQIGKTATCDCRVECAPGWDTFTCSQDYSGIFWCENIGYWSQYQDCDALCQSDGWAGSTGCGWSVNKGHDVCFCY